MTRKSMKVVVTVRQWNAVSSFRDARPNDAVFALNHETGNIAFGDGVNGAKLPVSSVITASYLRVKVRSKWDVRARSAPAQSRTSTRAQTSNRPET
jgi:hypothetical protein